MIIKDVLFFVVRSLMLLLCSIVLSCSIIANKSTADSYAIVRTLPSFSKYIDDLKPGELEYTYGRDSANRLLRDTYLDYYKRTNKEYGMRLFISACFSKDLTLNHVCFFVPREESLSVLDEAFKQQIVEAFKRTGKEWRIVRQTNTGVYCFYTVLYLY